LTELSAIGQHPVHDDDKFSGNSNDGLSGASGVAANF